MNQLDMESLADVLDIAESEPAVYESTMHLQSQQNVSDVPIPESSDDDIEQLGHDADYARMNLVELAEMTKVCLANAIQLAQTSERAREWEVVGGLIEKATNLNLQIIEVHKKKAEIGAKIEPEPSSVTNNTVAFVGTTADFLKELQKLNQQR